MNGGGFMAYKSKIFFVALALVAQLVSFGYAATEGLEAGDDSLWQVLPHPASETHFVLVSFSPVVVESEIVGTVAVYDDTATQRPADYSELYDPAGQLLAIRWFDRFGIERMAVDRGFLEEADKLEGVFVGVLDGELI
jgi:hypothetical protein